jgi:hypothetical protein
MQRDNEIYVLDEHQIHLIVTTIVSLLAIIVVVTGVSLIICFS